MSPGPSLAVVAKNTLAGGCKNGLATAWAHAFGIGVYAFATVLGFAVIIHHFPTVFQILTYLGAGYLAWLGIQALRSKGGVAKRLESGEVCSVLQSAKEGFLISMLNPKIALYFLALFSQFITEHQTHGKQFVLVMTPFLMDGLWYSFVVWMLSSQLLLNRLRKNAVWIDRISGVVLIGLAVRIVLLP